MELVPINSPRRVQVFIASSLNELKVLRLELGLFVYKYSELNYKNRDIFFSPFLCEYHSQAFKQGRNQDELNSIVSNSDLCCILIGNQVGKRTEEEFDAALRSFLRTGMPKICVFIQDQKHRLIQSPSVRRFKKKLKTMGRDYSLFSSSTKIISNMEAEFHIWYQEWERKTECLNLIREKGKKLRDSYLIDTNESGEYWADLCDSIFSYMQYLGNEYSCEYFAEESDYLFESVIYLTKHGYGDQAYEYGKWLNDYYDRHIINEYHRSKVNPEHCAELKLFIGRWLYDERLSEEALSFCMESYSLYRQVYNNHYGINRIERADRFLELSELIRDLNAGNEEAEYLLDRAEAICRHTIGTDRRLINVLSHKADLYDSTGRDKKANHIRHEIHSLQSNQVCGSGINILSQFEPFGG